MQSDIFFFISSIGFVLLTIALLVILYYALKAIRSFTTLLEKIEKNVDSVGDATKEMLEDVRESAVFRLITRMGSKGRRKITHSNK